MMRTWSTCVWRRCAGVSLALSAAGCLPNEDLSSYSSAADAEEPLVGSNSLIATRPPLANGVGETSAPIRADAPSGLEGEPALHADGGAPSPTPPATALPGAAATGSSLSGALEGESWHRLDVAGSDRSFRYYVPSGLDPEVPVPLLIVAHGFEESAAEMAAITGYDRIADREGFVVLYPEGQGLVPWNIGSGVCQGGARTILSARGDDSAFLDAMLAFVALERAIDDEHVFMSGLASGAYLASDLACRRSDIRAVVSHSGGSHALASCALANKPVLLLHGSEDSSVPAACSVESRDRWAAHNGCEASSERVEVLGGECEESLGCPESGQVTLCTFAGMGRGWAGGAAQPASFRDFASASELSWQFFETFAW